MINERYLEYLALRSILPTYDNSAEYNVRYANHTSIKINIVKLRDRLTELQKEVLEPYVIDSNSKE